MIVRLTVPGVAEAIVRAAKRAKQRGITGEIRERANGHVRATVDCLGTCGMSHFVGGRHDTVFRHDGVLTCDCVARESCQHAAWLVDHEHGVFPPAPEGTPDVPNSDWRCMTCSERFATVEEARAHSVGHAVNQFDNAPAEPLCPECLHPLAEHLENFGCTAGCVCQVMPANTPAVPSILATSLASHAAGAAPAPSRGSNGEEGLMGIEAPPAPPTGWRTPEDAAPLVDAEHARRRRILRVVE